MRQSFQHIVGQVSLRGMCAKQEPQGELLVPWSFASCGMEAKELKQLLVQKMEHSTFSTIQQELGCSCGWLGQ